MVIADVAEYCRLRAADLKALADESDTVRREGGLRGTCISSAPTLFNAAWIWPPRGDRCQAN